MNQLTYFGRIVKMRLFELNMTQCELAEKIGVNKNYLTDILRGRRAGTKYRDEILKQLGIEEQQFKKVSGG